MASPKTTRKLSNSKRSSTRSGPRKRAGEKKTSKTKKKRNSKTTSTKKSAGKKKVTRKTTKKTAKKTTNKATKKTAKKSKKKIGKKKGSAKGGKNTRRGSWRGKLLRGLLLVVLLGLAVLFLYGLSLDRHIKGHFADQPWQQPARVYARAQDVYAGLALSTQQLEQRLLASGYRKVQSPQNSGEFARGASTVRLITRELTLGDDKFAQTALEIRFSGANVSAVVDGAGRELPLARLEPQLIGNIIPRSGVDRQVVGADQVPALLRAMLIAVEDRRFHSHPGLDWRGILRAAWANFRAGKVVQGGSTINQQLIKSHFLTRDKTYRRKFKEALMAISLNLRMSKDDIMLAYINEIYLGQEGQRAVHGFDLASRFYFDRPLDELETAQMATLVGMVRGPSLYNPRRHPERALKRRNQVIGLVADAQVISQEAAQNAMAQPLGVVSSSTSLRNHHPAVLALVKQSLQKDYSADDLAGAGLTIMTTLDPHVQQRVVEALDQAVGSVEKSSSQQNLDLEAAAVVISPDTGELLAVAGGRRSGADGFNRAVDMRRPIGSLIKPFVYLAALLDGRYTLDSYLSNERISVPLENGENWEPRNFSGEYGGEVPLYLALAKSFNVPAVRTGLDVGLAKVTDVLQRMGFTRPIGQYPSLLLGALEMSPVEVAQLYLGLSGRGFVTPIRVVSVVYGADGEPLSRYPLKVEQKVDEIASYQILHNLQLVTTMGTARSLPARMSSGGFREMNIAGKTGSTNDLRDSWFAGVTGDAVTVVWVGNDDNQPTGLTGSRGALPVWAALMRAISTRSLEVFAPDGLKLVPFDPATGLSLRNCGGAVLLPLRDNARTAAQPDCASRY